MDRSLRQRHEGKRSQVLAMRKTALCLRVLAFILCLISFSVMAANKNKGWALDSFDRYMEFRYCMAVSILGFVYSTAQACNVAYHLTALVDMYSKCGDLYTANKCFDRSLKHDVILWSSLIGGYASHGKGNTALEMYSDFLKTGIQPNHVMFLAILTACVHNGFVEEGLNMFHSMTVEYGIQAKVEHCACIVDLLSRAGRVSEAYEFYKRMFIDVNGEVLGIILDACRSGGYDNMGDEITRHLLTLMPTSTGNYMQLAHNYASTKRWQGVGETWTQMRALGLKKVPGWSYVELQGIIEMFFTSHFSHPLFEEMSQTLGSLYNVMGKLASPDGEICSSLDIFIE